MPQVSPAQALTAGRARTALLVAAGLTLLLYLVPFGRFVAWPLMLFSTFVHEMGHGIAGILVGGHFDSFQMWPGGSGLAHVDGYSGALARAFVSAGGLVGPAVLAAVFFNLGRRPRLARLSLLGFALACAVAGVVVVRNPFGWGFVAVLAGACLWLARRGSPAVAQVAVIFLAIQLSLSVFSRGDYLFTSEAKTGAGTFPSDVANIATALGGPYWFWGAVVGALSVLVLVAGLRAFLKTATSDV